jgi:lipopolysaccharide transport system ATP-binding protein
MSGDVVIRAEGLGKKYIIGHESERERYTALRDVVIRTARDAWRRTADMARGRAIVAGDTTEEFWALRGVDFEVRRGEVLGVIGRNGAGKSTLLKILSRITEPSEGRVTIEGRVASLLEVGTGFHPELTGRENIYLNGAILGMTQAEIRRKFDEIVAFAEVERFLDTPVKRYSSGMYVRLAFAVAAHLEPEIMVVDEVLAVGDAEFQKKCLGKMSDVAKGGRTVLFVSHNMGAVLNLCSRAILLQAGAIRMQGAPGDVISAHLQSAGAPAVIRDAEPKAAAYINRCSLTVLRPVHGQSRLQLDIEIVAKQRLSPAVEFFVRDAVGNPVAWGTVGALGDANKLELEPGRSRVVTTHDISQLADGRYRISLLLSRPDVEYIDRLEDCLEFTLDESPAKGAHRRLHQRWGFGSFEIPYLSHAVEPLNGAEGIRASVEVS